MYKVYLKAKVFKGCKRHGFGGVKQLTVNTTKFANLELHLIHLEYSKECVWLEEWEEKM
jgi:hypothetical protein